MEFRRYNRDYFVDLLHNTQGIVFLREGEEFGVKTIWFNGITGNTVMIDITDMEDDIDRLEGKGILKLLGLSDWVDKLFCPIQEVESEQAAIFEHEELKKQGLDGL